LNQGQLIYDGPPHRESLYSVIQYPEILIDTNPVQKTLEIISKNNIIYDRNTNSMDLTNLIDFKELFYINDIIYLFTLDGVLNFLKGIVLFFTQFFGCFVRSLIQQGRNIKNIVSDLSLICFIGFIISFIFSGDIYIGSLPDSLTSKCGVLSYICELPGKDQILSSSASLNLAVVMLGIIYLIIRINLRIKSIWK
jgi:hypothetical protein